MRSGWLLLPALAFGVAAVILIIRGIQTAQLQQTIIPAGWILIVAWAALTLAEVNMLYGTGALSLGTACGFFAVTVLFALVSLQPISYIITLIRQQVTWTE